MIGIRYLGVEIDVILGFWNSSKTFHGILLNDAILRVFSPSLGNGEDSSPRCLGTLYRSGVFNVIVFFSSYHF